MNSRVAVASILQLVSRGTVSMLTRHIQKFIRAFAFGIDSQALQLSPGVSNKLSDLWRGYVRHDDVPPVVKRNICLLSLSSEFQKSCSIPRVLPCSGRFHFHVRDLYLDQITDRDKANQPALLHYGHVAKSVNRHFRHQ